MSLFSVQVKMFKSKKKYIICLTSKYRRVHVSFFNFVCWLFQLSVKIFNDGF